MNSSDNLTDNEVAFAAMNLFANKPTGPEPDWQEIHDWHEDLLDAERAEQVLSHVANDPEVFQKWRDICEAQEFLSQSPLEDEQTDTATQNTGAQARANNNPAPWDLVGWLAKAAKAFLGRPLPAIGGAVAATFLAVLIVPKLLNTSASHPGDMVNASLAQYNALGAPLPQTALVAHKTRSLAGILGDLSNEEVEKHQLQYGFKQAFDTINNSNTAQGTDNNRDSWSPWQQSLPESPVDCSLAADAQHCEQISSDMNTLGQWALLNHLVCAINTSVSNEFQQQQAETINSIIKLESLQSSTVLAQQAMTKQADQSNATCSLANGLINIASE